MQKKYKLVKTYPGSPELGTIAEYREQCNDYLYKDNNNYYVSLKCNKYPEFWEEIVERDWKILDTNISDNLKQSISSVKRLSDGEIFTIGDELTEGTILRFYLSDYNDGIYLDTKKISDNNIHSYYGLPLDKWVKYKQPLFTTEDGVDIYEYDAIWVVSSNFNTIYTTAFSNKYGNSKTAYKIVFSNKKAAEEYILWNKPCLSLNDVASIYPGVNKNHSNTPSHQAERLKELVKSKL
jgi:hypothetical protein